MRTWPRWCQQPPTIPSHAAVRDRRHQYSANATSAGSGTENRITAQHLGHRDASRRTGTRIATSNQRHTTSDTRHALVTTMRYDRARTNLDRHPNYVLAAYTATGT
ncbi:hypothetical protein GCM10009565_37230 [Amycolatopsis albidoflavus]